MAALKPYEVVTVEQGPASRHRFIDWVNIYGVSRLARSVGADRKTVHTWTAARGFKYPHATTVQKILMLSTIEPLKDGPLRYEDVLGTVQIVTRETKTQALEANGPSCGGRRYLRNFGMFVPSAGVLSEGV